MEDIRTKVDALKQSLAKEGIVVKFDDDDQKRPGWKFSTFAKPYLDLRL